MEWSLKNKLAVDYSVFILDGTRLKQILINLVNNAIKFTNKGKVSIILEVLPYEGEEEDSFENAQLIFHIEDTGIGIPEDSVDKIFEPFSQIDTPGIENYGSTGIGLSICQKLVAAMDGEITVSSHLGVGSKFIVKFNKVAIDKDTQVEDRKGMGQGTVAHSKCDDC